MDAGERPWPAIVLAALLAAAAAATGYVGTMALGYLVPAAVLALEAILIWLGRGRPVVLAIAGLALVSGAAMELVIDLGDSLGDRKLDISGAALLVNVAAGGPLMTLLSVAILVADRLSRSLRSWLAGHRRQRP